MSNPTETLNKNRVLSKLREKLSGAKMLSVTASQAEVARKEAAAQALKDLIEVDGVNGNGVRFEFEGNELAAFACQPDPGKYWDGAPLIEWLKANGHWEKVRVTTLDPAKLEAELAAGNIKRDDIAKFQVTGEPKAPSVKWINPKPQSL